MLRSVVAQMLARRDPGLTGADHDRVESFQSHTHFTPFSRRARTVTSSLCAQQKPRGIAWQTKIANPIALIRRDLTGRRWRSFGDPAHSFLRTMGTWRLRCARLGA